MTPWQPRSQCGHTLLPSRSVSETGNKELTAQTPGTKQLEGSPVSSAEQGSVTEARRAMGKCPGKQEPHQAVRGAKLPGGQRAKGRRRKAEGRWQSCRD